MFEFFTWLNKEKERSVVDIILDNLVDLTIKGDIKWVDGYHSYSWTRTTEYNGVKYTIYNTYFDGDSWNNLSIDTTKFDISYWQFKKLYKLIKQDEDKELLIKTGFKE